MKSIFSLRNVLILISLFSTFCTQAQNILRVSTMPGSAAPYTTVQAAINAASPGDIILLEGSSIDYPGDINVNKKVTIQGPGYLLNENTGIQFINYPANISYYGSFSFTAGSEGSAMYGVRLDRAINIYAANITIANNLINANVSIVGVSGCNINGNYSYGTIYATGDVANFIVSNNYCASLENINGNSYGIFANNVIFGGYAILNNSSLTNNVFMDAVDPLTINNCVVSNNIFAKATVPGADATNYLGIPASAVFVLTGTTDMQWKLKPGSVAVGGGVGGTDIGMYGGVTAPYRPSGIRQGQPSITNFSSPGTVPQNGTLTIKVSAKVN